MITSRDSHPSRARGSMFLGKNPELVKFILSGRGGREDRETDLDAMC